MQIGITAIDLFSPHATGNADGDQLLHPFIRFGNSLLFATVPVALRGSCYLLGASAIASISLIARAFAGKVGEYLRDYDERLLIRLAGALEVAEVLGHRAQVGGEGLK